ncbi:hypothetical protein F2P56_001937 [Juglans regia]|uniref:Uncharacterized protein LOC109020667 n=2 Tax=Juglans regia TaxID=51240 RepID=A0A2I4HRG3_JUGRE|nr:uncharacterized protein LOC109020667 [Juglans regia]KAF5481269.1 hypothetical protein F2P56_001937 [Juglans regia]
MAGKWEVGFPKTSSCSLREQAARSILRNVRTQGHTYVDLREDGKRFVFFCTLCLAPCYSDTILFDHLKGSLHAERLSTAKVTLLGPNPWPFNDGVLFFDNPVENDKELGALNGNKSRFLELPNNGDNLAIVRYDENSKTTSNGHAGVHLDNKISFCDETLNSDGGNACVIISGVRIWDEISDIEVQEVGCGKIAARFREKDKVSNGVCRIWCEWLGKKTPGNEDSLEVPEHDFAIVTFRYNADIGSKELFDRVKPLLLSSPSESECVEGASRKRMKSFSDPEDISEFFKNRYALSGEDSPVSNVASSRLLLTHYDDQLLHKSFISSKAMRRELRQQQRVAAERMCDICQHKMLPGKDVSALMNVKTGRLVCSSRNVHGAFHVFHTSCIIHWLLFCEYEIITKELVIPKSRKRRSKRNNAAKCEEIGKDGEVKATGTEIYSVFCPECQGTGKIIEGDELERPPISLSEMFKYKLKVIDARKAWMKSPEVLENCSTGFHFPCQSGEITQEKVKPLKLLRFYESDV